MSAYIEKVKASGDTRKAKCIVDEDAARTASSWQESHRPLKDRLADLLSTIPQEVKATGLSLTQLQVQLRGRKASKAHPGDIGTALRQLGYRRVRVWKQTDAEGFGAIWRTK